MEICRNSSLGKMGWSIFQVQNKIVVGSRSRTTNHGQLTTANLPQLFHLANLLGDNSLWDNSTRITQERTSELQWALSCFRFDPSQVRSLQGWKTCWTAILLVPFLSFSFPTLNCPAANWPWRIGHSETAGESCPEWVVQGKLSHSAWKQFRKIPP